MTESEYFKSIDHKFKKLGNVYKIGNKKIGNDTIIFNMQPATKCISKKLGLCQLKNLNYCYAWLDEKRYKNTLEYRLRQQKLWRNAEIGIIVRDFIHIRSVRPAIRYIRFNESGDITNLRDIKRLNHIANSLEQYGIVVYTYTARQDMFERNTIALTENLIINGSGFMVDNNYKVIDHPLREAGLICCGYCIECCYCKTKLNKVIHVELITNGSKNKGNDSILKQVLVKQKKKGVGMNV